MSAKFEGVELGGTYRDSITKLEGVAVSLTKYLYACARVTLQPTKLIDGKTQEAHTFDVHQVEHIAKSKTVPNPAQTEIDDPEIELGAIYRDSITKFEGVALSITYFLYSTARVVIQPTKMHEGKPVDAHFFEAHQLELVKPASKSPAKPLPEKVEKTGGPGGLEARGRATAKR